MRDKRDEKKDRTALRSNVAMFLFGVAILTYLVAIDRTEWFHLRPASGTAVAISEASRAPASANQSAR